MKKLLFIFIIFLSLSVFLARNIYAASVSFEAPPSINTGENLDLVVNADTGGVIVNSFEFTINYNEDLFSFTGYSDDNAMVKFWIDHHNAVKGKINLSGIIPGGVSGLYDANKKGLSAIPLVHILFSAEKAGDGKFSFSDSKILENDGKGTPLSHDQNTINVIIKNNLNNNIGKEGTENVTNNDLANSFNPFKPIFLVILFVVIFGILCYKLKHKV